MDAERRPEPAERDRQRRRRRIGWLVVAFCTLALLVRTLTPETVGEQTRRQLEKSLSDHYRDLHVQIGRGRFEPGIGMIFEKISLKPRDLGRNARPIIAIDRIIAETDFDFERMKAGEMPFTARRMLVDGLQVTAYVGEDGKWSLEDLTPLPEFGPGCPLLIIRDAHLRLVSDPREPSNAIVLRDIDLRITRQHRDGEESIEIVGIGAGESVRSLELAVRCDGARQEWSGHALNLRFDRALMERLPDQLVETLRPLKGWTPVRTLHSDLIGRTGRLKTGTRSSRCTMDASSTRNFRSRSNNCGECFTSDRAA